jgi:uncharacterized protein
MKPLRIVIMAKAPRAGLAKTRLIPALGADGAAQLAQRMLQHALCEAIAAGLGPVELCRTPDEDASWQGINLPAGITLSAQGDGDLGARMERVAARVIAAGEALLLIGTDCPALNADVLRQIAACLHAADAVMVPASDGGYVALALRRHDAQLFSDIRWSTASVAMEQRTRIAQLGWSLASLPPLHDIDEPADLQNLPPEWNTAHA